MTTKKILMAASNAWNSVFQVGSHHLAREFLKLGFEVAFISDPISPLHVFGSSTFNERFELYSSGGLFEENFWTYVPFTLCPPQNKPLLRSSWVHRNWHKFTVPSVVKKAKANGFGSVDLLYFDTPSQLFWLDHIAARKTLYRRVDQNSGFKKTTQAMLEMEKELVERVDCVLCTAKSLLDTLPAKPKQAMHLPNGVPFSHFANPTAMPSEYTNISRPIIVYVGALEYWFDFKLVERVAQEMSDISFVFIGPIKENPWPSLKNVHFLGPKLYSEIPKYLQFADVGWIPFDVKNYPDLIHNVNPLKLYEYMASGLPVVATRWKELGNIGSPALLCSSTHDFISSLKLAIYNKESETMRRFAAKLDWSHPAKKIFEL
jgi:glycosyltransferase involved in cell wall biosynthesis